MLKTESQTAITLSQQCRTDKNRRAERGTSTFESDLLKASVQPRVWTDRDNTSLFLNVVAEASCRFLEKAAAV